MVNSSRGLEGLLSSWFQHSEPRCPGIPQGNQIRISGEETQPLVFLLLSQSFNQALKAKNYCLKE